MNEETLFTEAARRADPAERAAFLDAACGGDEALRRRVEALLSAHEAGGSFLEPLVTPSPPQAGSEAPTAPGEGMAPGPPGEGSLPATQPDTAAPEGTPEGWTDTAPFDAPSGPRRPFPGEDASGTVVGPYKLLEPIGEGGMGTVYMAEQTAPVRRMVALKVIKAGLDSRQVLARFEAERQALALMDHPNIARVLEAGATEQGRPYFVMELVKGVPITQFCDGRRLTPRERLELFLPVCQAVQHAHQKGIIHRDLKPSNVLVALYDGKPVPKVIDFGVAKATGQKLTEATLFTGFGAVVGTPEYMSPEQAQLNQLDIDTRSDIYSLGVLLYELLTGSTPVGRKRFKQAAILEVLRVIREEDPQRPSARLSTTEELPSIAANRNVEPRKLTGLVRGELDWIVMKALEKDRNRRYETANGLAADLRRYLDDEPVAACPPSAGYRLRKLARRNKGLLATAAVVLLALVAGTAVASWQAIRARKAEQLAERRLAAERAARKEADSNLQKAREAVDRMLSRVANERLKNVPQAEEVRKQLLEDALQFYEGFLKQRPTSPEAMRDRADALGSVGKICRDLGRYAEAESAFREEITQLEAIDATRIADPVEFKIGVGWAHIEYGHCLKFQNKYPPALAEYLEALRVANGLDSEFPGNGRVINLIGVSESMAGATLCDLDRTEEAELHLTRGLRLSEKASTHDLENHWWRMSILHAQLDLARVLERQGRLAQAESLLGQAREIARLATEKQRDETFYSQAGASVLDRLSRLQWDLGKKQEAIHTADEVVELYTRLVGDFPRAQGFRNQVISVLSWRAQILGQSEGHEEALEQHYRRACEVYQRLERELPEIADLGHRLAENRIALARLLHRRGKPDQGREMEHLAASDLDAIEASVRRLPESAPKRAQDAISFAHFCLWGIGKPERAEAILRQELAVAKRAGRDESRDGVLLRVVLAEAFGVQRRHPEAVAVAREAVELEERLTLQPDPQTPYIVFVLGKWLHEGGRDAEAVEVLFRSASLSDRFDSSEWMAFSLDNLAKGLWGLRDPSSREKTGRRCLDLIRSWEARHPDDPRVPRWRALAAAALGRHDGARAAMVEARRLARDPASLNGTVWFLVRFGTQRELAAECASAMQKALEAQPRSPSLWNTLGVARYRAGDWTGAIAALEQSQSFDPDRILAHNGFFLAMAHHQIGQADEARAWFDRSVAWMDEKAPNDVELRRFRAEAAALLGIAEDRMPNGEEAFASGP